MGKVNARPLKEYMIMMCTMILETLTAVTISRGLFLVAKNIHTQGVAELDALLAKQVILLNPNF